MSLYAQKGVYCIFNPISNKIYIGSTQDSFGSRWKAHRSKLNRHKHPNNKLQASWDKHGESNFLFNILYTGSEPDEIINKEQEYLNKFYGKNCYNLRPIAASNRGYKIPDTSKIIEANKRIRESGDYRQKLSSAQTKRYSNTAERIRQSDRIKEVYRNNPALLDRRRKGRKVYNVTLISPSGEEFYVEQELKAFCLEHNLHCGTVYQIIKGTSRAKTCKGWRIK